MPRLFDKKTPNTCPLPENNRLWLEQSFLLLLDLFGRENTKQRKVLVPHHSDFPIKYNGDIQTAFDTLKIIARQMEVPFEKIHLDLYDEDVKEIASGSIWGGKIFLQSQKDDHRAAGMYWGKAEDDRYNISLVKSMLTQPENMVATLAHEIAHIKLLGEERIEENDEKLTDLVTVFFGLGIFNANAAFQMHRGVDYSEWRTLGYLTQMEWGYAQALFAHVREETTPDWIKHLNINVKEDFIQGEKFIEANLELIFKPAEAATSASTNNLSIMNTGLDIQFIRESYERMGDEELMRIATRDSAYLTQAAQEILNEEIEKRKFDSTILKAVEVQNKTYTIEEVDMYCDIARNLHCPSCGVSGSKLNGTMISEVISFILFTQYNKKLKVGCPGCLDKANNSALTKTAILGWWGIPWGIIRTIQAIGHNIKSKSTNHLDTPNDYLRSFILSKAGQFETYKDNQEKLQQIISSN